jgi:outer membrane receptor for Fe3+-dicitrate
MTQADMQAYQARRAAFAAKVEAFAATLTEEESGWLTGIIATAAGSEQAVNGYFFNNILASPVFSSNLNNLTQTAVGIGNIGNVSNSAVVLQSSNASLRG